jgi:hypothetical protein
MKRTDPQRDLFGRPQGTKPTTAAIPPRTRVEPFDFLRDGDALRCMPDPAWIVPAELRLPTDDPEWQPGNG